jgi:hypothetical protein
VQGALFVALTATAGALLRSGARRHQPADSPMDIYNFSLYLGGSGLALMALGGLGRHGPGRAHHSSHHGGATHGGASHGVAHHGSAHHGFAAKDWAHSALWSLMSPRVLFSVLLGFGAGGVLGGRFLSGAALFAVAAACGVGLERLVVAPLWRFLFRFASAPAQTLESTLYDEARATSGFDANGEGLVALEVDGQVVQVLGTLCAEDRRIGLRVRAGDRVRVEEVDGARHRCTVSYVARE